MKTNRLCALLLSAPLLIACNNRGATTQDPVSGQAAGSVANGPHDPSTPSAGNGKAGASAVPVTNSMAGSHAGTGTNPSAGAAMDAGMVVDAATKPKVPPPPGSVSKPGEYKGYGESLYKGGYELTSQYVPVRDGTKLALDLYRPKDGSGVVSTPLPVIWMHTPYNRRTFSSGVAPPGPSAETYPGYAARLIEFGYVVAIVDFRGVYASAGKNAGYNRGEWMDAAHLDAYDITEWLAKQPWSTGNIGMWGCSATGGSQIQAITTAPPHLKAVFPMSCEFDAYPFGVSGGMSPASGDTKAPPGGGGGALRDATAQAVDGDLGGQQLSAAIADHSGNIENPGYVPFRDSVAANIPEKWWLKSSPSAYLDQIKASGIAMYVAANWDEGYTKHGAFFWIKNVTNPIKLVVGPQTHCAWSNVQMQTGFDITVEEHRFFDYWLKGVDNGVMDEPKVYYYTYNEAAGKEWRSANEWPLSNERRTPYYLGVKTLVTAPPTDASAKDDTTVNYNTTATDFTGGLTYDTAALDKDIRITGHALVDLWVASTASEGDFVATLQDVGPDGRATTYNMQARLRGSLRKEGPAPYDNLDMPYHPFGQGDLQPFTPAEPTRLRFDMLPISILFKAGHRIRLVLTFADTQTAVVVPAPTVSIFHDAMHQSSITLPIIDN